jgi:hypothetical protein
MSQKAIVLDANILIRAVLGSLESILSIGIATTQPTVISNPATLIASADTPPCLSILTHLPGCPDWP